MDTIITPTGCCSYFFIDDICLSTDSNLCYSVGLDNLIVGNKNNMIVFPNPSSDIVNVSTSKKVTDFNIYNLQGQNVTNKFEINFKQENKITVKKIDKSSNGLFILKFKTEGRNISKLISLTN